ncbi:MAG: hypothetical protein ACRDRV_06205 [Pseudonocardiaceae bacterium]
MTEPDIHHDRGSGGIGYCIRPGAAVPATVLVVDMGDGALLLQGWRMGPSAYVCPTDTGPLRSALAAAFGSTPTDTGTGTGRQQRL